jgi:hypothetical protein
MLCQQCSGVVAGDTSDAVVPNIFKFITFSRAALREGTSKKILLPFAVPAIGESISVPRLRIRR